MTAANAKGAETRAAAARAIDAVLHEGRSLKAVLGATLRDVPDPRDRALVEAIAFQTLRHLRRYRFVLGQWMDKPLPAREHQVESLLLAGLAQVDALAMPAHAVVSATAEAARLLRKPAFVGLVNALLRRATREALPSSDDPAIAHSYPDWLLARLRQDWPERLADILAAGNEIAPLWLRVNARMADRKTYLQSLRDAHIVDPVRDLLASLKEAGLAHAGADQPVTSGEKMKLLEFLRNQGPKADRLPRHGLRLDDGAVPGELPGWSEGLVSVQDGAAQLAVEALAPRDGERVLDLCCAPGGKSAAMIESADFDLVAVDIDPQRLTRVDTSLQRLRLRERATLVAADGADIASWWDGKPFDAVLLDAPCSATGIVRRQPDIKWNRRESDLVALNAVQDRLLDAAWRVLKPGGRLLYATCSILHCENGGRIEAFLARTGDASESLLDERFGHVSAHGRQRLPGEDGMDGFYYALLLKNAVPIDPDPARR